MSARVLIVGQGLAGTTLGLELEVAGVDFVVVSAGHERAASRVAAGLINPVTGQRWVKSTRVEELRPIARESYARWSALLGVELWHPLQLTRWWRNEAERALVERKLAAGDLAPFATAASVNERGVGIEGAAWVDLPALLGAAAQRWRERGKLRELALEGEIAAADLDFSAEAVEWGRERFDAAVLCTGSGRLARELFGFLPFATAKGEMLAVRGCPLPAGTAVSRGTWLIAGAGGTARVGATYERDREDFTLSAEARARLLADAEMLAGGAVEAGGQSAGVRLSLPDRRPVVGWHPTRPRLGIFGALGSKGALWAPWLAQVWRDAALDATKRFPVELSVGRGGK
ncbi:MAG: hypothetical protein C0518_13065 [Opitutus sp.]|nr:hypothetical protein [Opitutus sp.]